MQQIEHVKIRGWNINWIHIIGVHIGTKKHNWEIDDFISSTSALEFSWVVIWGKLVADNRFVLFLVIYHKYDNVGGYILTAFAL